MKSFVQWAAVLAVATALDLAIRFLLPFNLARVLAVESLLFPATGWVLLHFSRRAPGPGRGTRIVQVILIAGFFLAGLRSLLWVLGVPVQMANLVVVILAALAWIGFRRRALKRKPLSEDTPSA